MAKKRKRKSDNAVAVPMSASGGSSRHSVDISEAENGYIVNVSGETGGKESKYYSKRFIASDRPEAIRISSSALAGRSKGSKKKGIKGKRITSKKI